MLAIGADVIHTLEAAGGLALNMRKISNEGVTMKIYLDEFGLMPERAHEYDAGLDLKTPNAFILEPGKSAVVDTGVHVSIPAGMAGFLKSKSGLNVNNGITSEGVIDTGYSGSIAVKLYNLGDKPKEFKAGDKITQLVILPVCLPKLEVITPEELNTECELLSGRGDNGFGSTGR